ncbi:DUF3224 domain-containing protein [Agreia sp.]|uniref:DUF3224 domain-containing protein n=1 Tax=Agreia sp. TaxID=1872416 RepID=UPI0035BC7ED0
MIEDAPIIAPFEITGWDQAPYGEVGERNELARVTVTKVFTGDIEGQSVAQLLMAGNPVGAGYLASESFTGTVGARSGSFVVQHGGLVDSADAHSFGSIVPGSGTGELAGVRGEAIYADNDEGHTLTLTLRFVEEADA